MHSVVLGPTRADDDDRGSDRFLALLETASLPGADRDGLLAQAREQVEEMSELVDDVLFLSELESGREVVALRSTSALPVLEEVRDRLADSAERADVGIVVDASADVELPLPRRMLRVVVDNLAKNASGSRFDGSTIEMPPLFGATRRIVAPAALIEFSPGIWNLPARFWIAANLKWLASEKATSTY